MPAMLEGGQKQRLRGKTSARHVWLIMLKALSAIARQLDVDL